MAKTVSQLWLDPVVFRATVLAWLAAFSAILIALYPLVNTAISYIHTWRKEWNAHDESVKAAFQRTADHYPTVRADQQRS